MVRQTEGDLTAENIKAELPNAKGHTFFRTTDYDCSAPVWPGTTACGAGVIFVKATPERLVEEMPLQPARHLRARPRRLTHRSTEQPDGAPGTMSPGRSSFSGAGPDRAGAAAGI